MVLWLCILPALSHCESSQSNPDRLHWAPPVSLAISHSLLLIVNLQIYFLIRNVHDYVSCCCSLDCTCDRVGLCTSNRLKWQLSCAAAAALSLPMVPSDRQRTHDLDCDRRERTQAPESVLTINSACGIATMSTFLPLPLPSGSCRNSSSSWSAPTNRVQPGRKRSGTSSLGKRSISVRILPEASFLSKVTGEQKWSSSTYLIWALLLRWWLPASVTRCRRHWKIHTHIYMDIYMYRGMTEEIPQNKQRELWELIVPMETCVIVVPLVYYWNEHFFIK